MGLFFSKIYDRFVGKTDAKLVMVGLDAAGKTTVLYKLQLGEVLTTIPTIGFNVEQLEYKNLRFTVWDIGGQDKIRKLWRHYFEGNHGLIFVVDSSDRDRAKLAGEELGKTLAEEALHNLPVLIYANKQDLPQAMSTAELSKEMELFEVCGRDREWYVQPATATTGNGLYEGLDWLSRAVEKAVRNAR